MAGDRVAGLLPIDERVRRIVARGSPLIEQGRTEALQRMQRRGLLNSSLAVGEARRAALNVALPIAAQEFGTEAELLRQQRAIGLQERVSLGRQQTALLAAYQQAYSQALQARMPAKVRNKALDYLNRFAGRATKYLNQLYGIDFDIDFGAGQGS